MINRINEKKAVSASQQRLFGMVSAYKNGKLKLDKLPDSLVSKIKSIADGERKKTGDKRKFTKGMDVDKIKDIASTKHDEIVDIEENNVIKFDDFLNEERTLEGGKADGKDLYDIAKLHNVPIEYLEKILPKAIDIEMAEHTTDIELAEEIVFDHLMESPIYYDDIVGLPGFEEKLEEMEEEEINDVIKKEMENDTVIKYENFE